MKVLVTGGLGYIGLSLIGKLVRQPEVQKVLVFDNLSKNHFNFFFDENVRSSKLSFVEGDILDNHRLKDVLKDCNWIYHLASVLPNSRTTLNLHTFDQVNHWGTAQLADAVERSNAEGIVYTSSTEVYGQAAHHATEDMMPCPTTHYGKSKLNAERQLQRLSGRLKVFRMRIGKVYGYNNCFYAESVINRMLFEAHHYNQIIVDGDGSEVRGYSYLQAVAEGLARLIHNLTPPDVYNMVSANFSTLDIVSVLEKIYPELEKRFVSQDLAVDSIAVRGNEKVIDIPENEIWDLERNLRAMREMFSVSR